MKITYKDTITLDAKMPSQAIIDLILKNRGITDVETFLHPKSPLEIDVSDFGFKKEITHFIKLLTEIKEKGQNIVVYTDYDADGITGGTVMWETLHLLGFNVMPYVPHRITEGYGFSIKGIDNVKAKFNPSLIISVDHGIAAADKIDYARSIGIPVVITDHHMKNEFTPQTEATFHIPELSGSGVSYFVAKAIAAHFKKGNINEDKLDHYFENDYMAIASIGTIADLVPLVGASRSLVKHGLDAFPRVKRHGVTHILHEAGISDKKITPYEIGFIIAPRINAIGRLQHAMDALRLLCTTSEQKAFELASSIGALNVKRQDLVKAAIDEALVMVEAMESTPSIIVLVSETWHEGIIGLVASKIVEKYSRPAIIITKAEGMMKGSARSIPTFHITSFLQGLKQYLNGVGGHKQAAGFTVTAEYLETFVAEIGKQSVDLMADVDLEKTIDADLFTPLKKITLPLAQKLELLEPFGIGNPNPIFVSDTTIIDKQFFGKLKNHLKLHIGDAASESMPLEVIAFSQAELGEELKRGQHVKIAYQLEIDRWNGRERLRARLVGLLPL